MEMKLSKDGACIGMCLEEKRHIDKQQKYMATVADKSYKYQREVAIVSVQDRGAEYYVDTITAQKREE